MARLLSLVWLLFSICVTFDVYGMLESSYIMVTSAGEAWKYFSYSMLLVLPAILSYMNSLFLWRRANSWFVCIIAAIYALYFIALLVCGEDEGESRYLISSLGVALCGTTIIVAKKFNVPSGKRSA